MGADVALITYAPTSACPAMLCDSAQSARPSRLLWQPAGGVWQYGGRAKPDQRGGALEGAEHPESDLVLCNDRRLRIVDGRTTARRSLWIGKHRYAGSHSGSRPENRAPDINVLHLCRRWAHRRSRPSLHPASVGVY